MMDEYTWILCDCYHDALAVTQAPDMDGYVEIAFWRYGHGNRLRNRLRLIWQIIRYGHPYADCVILSPDKVRELVDRLSRGQDDTGR